MIPPGVRFPWASPSNHDQPLFQPASPPPLAPVSIPPRGRSLFSYPREKECGQDLEAKGSRVRGEAKNKLPVWAFRFKKLRQPEKTTEFQENACRLSQILKSSPPTGVCPLMKETIRMTSCGLRAPFSCGWFLSCMPKPAIYFSNAPYQRLLYPPRPYTRSAA